MATLGKEVDGGLKGLKAEDRIGGPPERRRRGRIPFFVFVVAMIVGGYFAYHRGYISWIEQLARQGAPQRAADTGQSVAIAEIGIGNLPFAVANASGVRSWLERLKRETCDRAAIEPLAAGLKAEGYARQAAEALSSFYDRCNGAPELLDEAVENLMSLSDFKRAYELADTLVKADPAYARYRYLRGSAAEKLGRLEASLVDHVDALNLLGDPANVAGSMFYEIAQAHARLGQYCEAITPIQQWVSYDNVRNTPQTRTIIKEYVDKGRCDLYAKAPESFSMPIKGDVILATVVVNGASGSFIIDTGASLVYLSETFARRANVDWDPTNEIQVQTANGLSTAVLSRAKSIALGAVAAQDVTVGISSKGAFDKSVDGLLGMSFLARFQVSLTPHRFEIRRVR